MNRGGNFGGFNNNNNSNIGNSNGGFIPQDSPAGSSPKGEGKNRSNQSLMPVTVKQIIVAPNNNEDSFHIDGREINQLSLVGVILQPQPQDTNFSFQLDDGTGWIDVRIWNSEEKNHYTQDRQSMWTEGTYVRVIGHLRSFNSRRSIVAFRVIPVSDFNEITYHLLETIYVHLFNKNGGQPANQQLGGNFFQQAMSHQNFNNVSTNNMARGGQWSDLQRAVHASFSESNDDNGFSISHVVNRLRGRFNEGEIREAIGFLSQEGHLYSTIDDDYYKAT